MRSEKKVMVKEIRSRIKESNSLIFTQFSALDAQALGKIRNASFDKKSKYMVVKNRLFKRAADEEKLGDLGIDLKGSTGVLFGTGDAAGLAKTVVQFEKEFAGFKVQGGVLDNKVLTQDQVKYLASLPSKEELIAQLVRQMNAPISNFVGVLGALLRNLVNVLNQVKEKKEQAS